MRRPQRFPRLPRPVPYACCCYAGAHESSCWPCLGFLAALHTLWPRCGALRACVAGSPPIHAPAWRCFLAVGIGPWAWAEATSNDGTGGAASAQAHSLGLALDWGGTLVGRERNRN